MRVLITHAFLHFYFKNYFALPVFFSFFHISQKYLNKSITKFVCGFHEVFIKIMFEKSHFLKHNIATVSTT